MTEPVLALLKRTEAVLLAKAAQCLGSNSLDPLVLDALEGFARQLEDRAQQCAGWIFGVERWGDRMPKNREDDIRASCAEWLRMAE
jgi:hypothetical protein